MIAESVLCLALNVYFETAPKEPLEGSIAVAFVPRTRAEKNGTSVCWEVFSDMQFSWANDGRNLRSLPTGEKWDHSLSIAKAVVSGIAIDTTNGATHYHEKSKRPKWSRDPRMKRIGVWGSHIFYREER